MLSNVCLPFDEVKDLTLFNTEPLTDFAIQKIVIDPGHGGHDRGCSPSEQNEKDIVLPMAIALGNSIKRALPNIEIIYTRTNDEYLSLEERIDIANKAQADLFISLHCNYVKEDYVSGSETFIVGEQEHDILDGDHHDHHHHHAFDWQHYGPHPFYDNSRQIASLVEQELDYQTPFDSRGVKEANYHVLRAVNMPAILLEAGFLSNDEQRDYLISSNGQNDIVEAVTNALVTYIGPYQSSPMLVSNRTVVQKIQKIKKSINPSYKKPNEVTIIMGSSKGRPIIQLDQKWTKVKNWRVEKKDNVFLYSYGVYQNIEEAIEKKNELIELGFKGAYVSPISSNLSSLAEMNETFSNSDD